VMRVVVFSGEPGIQAAAAARNRQGPDALSTGDGSWHLQEQRSSSRVAGGRQ
jgi:hypothetical protein